jgi:hypothetical protein
MKHLLTALLVLMPLTAAAGSGHGPGEFTKHKSGSLFMVTAEKKFSIEMEVEGDTLKEGANGARIVIHDRDDKDVKGAKITVTPWMPGMGHGVPEKAVVTEEESMFGSRYQVENLVVNMGGHWEILVEVEKDGVKDGAVFDFPDVGGGGGMKHDMSGKVRAKPDGLDYSTTLASSKKLFTVSYAGDPSPLPMNRIHSWKVKIAQPSGEPVTGAMIMVSGDMPEHGHGLPTEPEVTAEVEPGVYLVEGMKFSMPGWWEVKLHIKAGAREDSVTFNLQLQ